MKKETNTELNIKKLERENDVKEHPVCEFIRINPNQKDFHLLVEISNIYNLINRSLENCQKNH